MLRSLDLDSYHINRALSVIDWEEMLCSRKISSTYFCFVIITDKNMGDSVNNGAIEDLQTKTMVAWAGAMAVPFQDDP